MVKSWKDGDGLLALKLHVKYLAERRKRLSYDELLDFVREYGKSRFDQGFRQGVDSTKPPKEEEPLCPDCGERHSEIRKDKNDKVLCDMVYGRRGWRQLGVYDG